MKQRKFYQSRGMLRAGRPQQVIRTECHAVAITRDGATHIATTDVVAVTRDCAGWPKAFARACAAYDPHHLSMYVMPRVVLDELLAHLNAGKPKGLLPRLA